MKESLRKEILNLNTSGETIIITVSGDGEIIWKKSDDLENACLEVLNGLKLQNKSHNSHSK